MFGLIFFGFHRIPYKPKTIKNENLSQSNGTYRADSPSSKDSKNTNYVAGVP